MKDAVEVLASKNVPRLGETYVCFIHPHQGRRLRDTPEWIEVTKYAAPGNFMLGEIGRLNDVVFIETTQIVGPSSTTGENDPWPTLPGAAVSNAPNDIPDWRANNLGLASDTAPGSGGNPYPDILQPRGGAGAAGGDGMYRDPALADIPPGSVDTYPLSVATPGWGAPWGPSTSVYEAMMLGDNAFGHAISLPVELRDGGVLDFGREHALAWYSIWGWGVITESSVVKIVTN